MQTTKPSLYSVHYEGIFVVNVLASKWFGCDNSTQKWVENDTMVDSLILLFDCVFFVFLSSGLSSTEDHIARCQLCLSFQSNFSPPFMPGRIKRLVCSETSVLFALGSQYLDRMRGGGAPTDFRSQWGAEIQTIYQTRVSHLSPTEVLCPSSELIAQTL